MKDLFHTVFLETAQLGIAKFFHRARIMLPVFFRMEHSRIKRNEQALLNVINSETSR